MMRFCPNPPLQTGPHGRHPQDSDQILRRCGARARNAAGLGGTPWRLQRLSGPALSWARRVLRWLLCAGKPVSGADNKVPARPTVSWPARPLGLSSTLLCRNITHRRTTTTEHVGHYEQPVSGRHTACIKASTTALRCFANSVLSQYA